MAPYIRIESTNRRIILYSIIAVVLMYFLQHIPTKSSLRGIIIYAQLIYIIHQGLNRLFQDEARASTEASLTKEDIYVKPPEQLTRDGDEQAENGDIHVTSSVELMRDDDNQTEEEDGAEPSQEAAERCQCPTCANPSRQCQKVRWAEHEVGDYAVLCIGYKTGMNKQEDEIVKLNSELIESRNAVTETQKSLPNVVQALSLERVQARTLRKQVKVQNNPRRTLAVVDKLKQDLEKQRKENASLREERDTERRKTNRCAEEVQYLEKEIEHLKQLKEDRSRKIEDVQSQHEADLAAYEALKKKFESDISNKVEELKEQKTLNDRLVGKNTKLSEENNQLSSNVNALNEENSTLTARNKELLDCENELANLRMITKNEKQELITNIDDVKRKEKAATKDLQEFKQKHEKTRTELDEYRQKYNAKKSELQESKDRLKACEKHKENTDALKEKARKMIEDKDAEIRDQLAIIMRLESKLRECETSRKKSEAPTSDTATHEKSTTLPSSLDASSQSNDNTIKLQYLLEDIRGLAAKQNGPIGTVASGPEVNTAQSLSSPVTSNVPIASESTDDEKNGSKPFEKPVSDSNGPPPAKLGEQHQSQPVKRSSDPGSARKTGEMSEERSRTAPTTVRQPSHDAPSPAEGSEQKPSQPGDRSPEKTLTAVPDVKTASDPVFRPAKWSFPGPAKFVKLEETPKLPANPSTESVSTLTDPATSKVVAATNVEKPPIILPQPQHASQDGSSGKNEHTEPRSSASSPTTVSQSFSGQDEPKIVQTPGDLPMGEADHQPIQSVVNNNNIGNNQTQESPNKPAVGSDSEDTPMNDDEEENVPADGNNLEDTPMSDDEDGQWENVQSRRQDESNEQVIQVHGRHDTFPYPGHNIDGRGENPKPDGDNTDDILMDDNIGTGEPDPSLETAATTDTPMEGAEQSISTTPFPIYSTHQQQQKLPDFVPPIVPTISVPPLSAGHTFFSPVAPPQQTHLPQSSSTGSPTNVITPGRLESRGSFNAATDPAPGDDQGTQREDVQGPVDPALQDVEGDEKAGTEELMIIENPQPTDAITSTDGQSPSSQGDGGRVPEGKELDDKMADATKDLDANTSSASGTAPPMKKLVKKPKSANRMFGLQKSTPPPRANPTRQTPGVTPVSAPVKLQLTPGNKATPTSPVEVADQKGDLTTNAALAPAKFGSLAFTPEAIEQDTTAIDRQEVIQCLERHQALRYLIKYSTARRNALEAHNQKVPKSLKTLIAAAERLDSEMDLLTNIAISNYNELNNENAEVGDFMGQAKLYAYDEDYNLQSLMREAGLPEIEQIESLMKREESKDLGAEMWWRGMGGKRLESS